MVASAPRHVTAADKKGVITVRWSAPSSDGGSAITSYTVVSLPSPDLRHELDDVQLQGTQQELHYSFEVRATNKVGASVLSAKSNAVRDN